MLSIVDVDIVGGGDDCEDCTPDELAAIIRELRDNSGLISSRTYHLITYRNCFIGRDFVTWLMKYKGFSSMFFNDGVC